MGLKATGKRVSRKAASMNSDQMVAYTVQDEDLFAANRLDQAETLRTEGNLLFARGNMKGAESKYWKALALKKEALGPYHLQVSELLDELAELYELTDNTAEALRFYQFAHSVKEKVLGLYHPAVVRSSKKLNKIQLPQRTLAVAS
jgi:tetratricopeptide (TPR) repeat protein